MDAPPSDLVQRLRRYEQEHVLRWWHELTSSQRDELVAQLQDLDLELLQRLYACRAAAHTVPSADRIAPVPVARLEASARETGRIGEELLRHGHVAILMVAGGQGTRLGVEQPKGMFPVGPVSGKSLFQVHAEKVLALGRRYRRSFPFLIMTSAATAMR